MEASKATVKMLMQDHYKARMNYYQIIHKLCENLTKMSKKLLVYVNAVFEIQIFLCCFFFGDESAKLPFPLEKGFLFFAPNKHSFDYGRNGCQDFTPFFILIRFANKWKYTNY